MAAQVAGDEPLSAANTEQAPMLEMIRPPGTRCSQRSSASYRSLPAGDDATAAPMTMNIGMDTRENSAMPAKKVSARIFSEPKPSKTTRKTTETSPRPKATGIPDDSTTMVLITTNKPMTSGLMIYSPSKGLWASMAKGISWPLARAMMSARYCSDSSPMPSGSER